MDSWIRSSFCESNACVEVSFQKSSFSANNGQCVEVGFRKSSASGPWSDACVEVAGCVHDEEILVRDSKDPNGPVLHFTPDEWKAFVAGIKAGELQ